jgi:hypothetical protein
MTVTEQLETEPAEAGESAEETAKRGRDFTKVREYHEQLANFINERSGLDAVSPNQVKATLALRTDYGNTDEAKAARAERKAAAEAEKQKYAGMTDDQKKAAKAATRADVQAEKLQKKAQEAIEKAQRLRLEATGSGEDLQTVVESNQAESEPESTGKRRGLGGRFR